MQGEKIESLRRPCLRGQPGAAHPLRPSPQAQPQQASLGSLAIWTAPVGTGPVGPCPSHSEVGRCNRASGPLRNKRSRNRGAERKAFANLAETTPTPTTESAVRCPTQIPALVPGRHRAPPTEPAPLPIAVPAARSWCGPIHPFVLAELVQAPLPPRDSFRHAPLRRSNPPSVRAIQ